MKLNDLITKLKEFNAKYPDMQLELLDKLKDQIDKINEENRLQIIDALISLLDRNKFPASTRANAVEILGIMKDKLGLMNDQKTKESLRIALNDPYKLVRSYSVRVLGDYKSKDLIKVLENAGLKDDFFGVRAEAVEALKKICEEHLKSNHEDVECLRVKDEVIPEILKNAKQDKDKDKRFEKRVGREKLDAENELEELFKIFSNNVEDLKKNTPKSILEKVKDNESVKSSIDKLQQNLASFLA